MQHTCFGHRNQRKTNENNNKKKGKNGTNAKNKQNKADTTDMDSNADDTINNSDNRDDDIVTVNNIAALLPELDPKNRYAVGQRFIDQCIAGSNNMFYIGPSFNTFFSGATRSKPDIIFGNKHTNDIHQFIEAGDMCGSDHCSVIFTVSREPIIIPVEPHYNYKNADWTSWKARLAKYANEQQSNLQGFTHIQIDKLIDNAIHAITATSDEYIPKVTHKIHSSVPPKSEDTRRYEICINNLNKRISLQNFTPTAPQIQLRTSLNTLLRESRDNDYEEYYNKIATDASKVLGKPIFWDKINEIKGNHGISTTSLKGGRNDIEKIITDPQKVVDKFHDTWKPIFFA